MADTEKSILSKAQDWLNTLGARERKGVVAAGVLVAVVFFWMVLLQPAMKKISESRQVLPKLEQQYASVRILAEKAKKLQAQTPIANRPNADTILNDIANCYGSVAQAQAQGDRIVATLTQATPEVLAKCLLAHDAYSADLTRVDGAWSGQLVFLVPNES
jgi:type II secretory pathway component PulM